GSETVLPSGDNAGPDVKPSVSNSSREDGLARETVLILRTVPDLSVNSVELFNQPGCVCVDARVNMSMVRPLVSATTNCRAFLVSPNTSLVPSGEWPGDGLPVVATT